MGPGRLRQVFAGFRLRRRGGAEGRDRSGFLFEELVSSACNRGASLGVDARPFIHPEISNQQIDPTELPPGEFMDRVRSAVENIDAKVVVIDSLNGLLQAMPNEETLTVQLHQMLTFLNQTALSPSWCCRRLDWWRLSRSRPWT